MLAVIYAELSYQQSVNQNPEGDDTFYHWMYAIT